MSDCPGIGDPTVLNGSKRHTECSTRSFFADCRSPPFLRVLIYLLDRDECWPSIRLNTGRLRQKATAEPAPHGQVVTLEREVGYQDAQGEGQTTH
jgi:hypothetical protein